MNGIRTKACWRMKRAQVVRCCALMLVGLTSGGRLHAQAFYQFPSYTRATELRADASLYGIAAHQGQVLAVGAYGAVLRWDSGNGRWVLVDSTVDCQLDDVVWIDAQNAVAVGGAYDPITNISRGCVIVTRDAGRTWYRSEDRELPRLRHIRRLTDGTLIASSDWSHPSLANVFESQDAGRTWNPSLETGSVRPEPSPSQKADWMQFVQIRSVVRDVDRDVDQSVWAAGDHGVIIHRRADQQDWVVHRAEQVSPALVVVVRDGQTAAWPLIARAALQNRYRVSILVTEPSAWRSADSTHSSIDLIRQVACSMGVSSVDEIGGDPNEIHSVANTWMSIHRPSALLLDGSIEAKTRSAFTQSAVSHGAERVMNYALSGRGDARLHRDALLPGLGVLVSDLWKDSFAILSPNHRAGRSIAISTLYDAGTARLRSDSLLSGINLRAKQMLSAKMSEVSRRQIQIAQGRLRLGAQISGLLKSSSRDVFQQSLSTLLGHAALADQPRMAWAIYQQLIHSPKPLADRAAFHEIMLREMMDRFPGTPYSQFASLRLEAIEASDEWGRLRPLLASWDASSSSRDAVAQGVAVSPFQVENPVQQASANLPVLVPEPKAEHVAMENPHANDVDLIWEFHPARLFADAARRRQSETTETQRVGDVNGNLKRLLDSSSGDWPALLNPTGMRALHGYAAKKRPRLDGVLNDECWRQQKTALGSSSRFLSAYDDEYIYLAVRIPSSEVSVSQQAQTGASVRDLDLSASDRVQLWIDTDGDLITSYQFEFNKDGATHDSVDGHPEWQPTWYVANKQDGDMLQAELAIRLRDLVSSDANGRSPWFVRIGTISAGQVSLPECIPDPRRWRRLDFLGSD